MVCPVNFSHNVTPTFSRSILRVDTRKKVGKNRMVEKHRNPVSKKKSVKMAVFGGKLPRNYPEPAHIVPKRHLLPRNATLRSGGNDVTRSSLRVVFPLHVLPTLAPTPARQRCKTTLHRKSHPTPPPRSSLVIKSK